MYEILLNTLLLVPNITRETKERLAEDVMFLSIIKDENQLYDFIAYDYYIEKRETLCYSDFINAFNKAKTIESEAKKIGFEILGIGSKLFPSKLKSIISPLTVLYVKGNIKALGNNMIACFGNEKSSEFVNKCINRIGFRIAENNITLISNLNQELDQKLLEGHLQSSGNIIGLIDTNYKECVVKLESNINWILQNGGCIVSLNPPGGIDNVNQLENTNHLKICLSDAIIIVEMNDCIPVEKMKINNKDIYCISYPGNYSNLANELLISGGQALPIRNRDDILSLTIKISSNYSIVDNSIVHCFKSNKGLKYYDKLLLKVKTKKLGIITFNSMRYDISEIEIDVKENRITKVIDHDDKKVYIVRDECMVTIDEKRFEKFQVLFNVRNIINNCDICLYQRDDQSNDISIDSYERECIAFYTIKNNELENDKIKLELNNSNELVYIFDKDTETYFYPLENKRVLFYKFEGKYRYREIYFNSEYRPDCIHPRRPLDWDCAYFAEIDELIIKHHPHSNEVFRLVCKRSGDVFYINPLYSEDLHRKSLKDYEEFVITNKIEQEGKDIQRYHNDYLKNEIKNGLLKIIKQGYQDYEIVEFKKSIFSQLEICAETAEIDRAKKEFIIDYKYEQIISAIDEIVNIKSKKIFEDNLVIIFEILEDDLDNYFDDDWMLPLY